MLKQMSTGRVLATRQLGRMGTQDEVSNASSGLNGVIGMTGLILDTHLDAEQREYASIIRSSGEALLSLLNDILDFSKIEADKVELEQINFDLRGSIEEVLDLVAFKAHEKKLELAVLMRPEVPTRVLGDPGRPDGLPDARDGRL